MYHQDYLQYARTCVPGIPCGETAYCMSSHGLTRKPFAAALGPAESGFGERMASLIYKDAPGAARCGIIRELAMTILKYIRVLALLSVIT